MKQREIKFRAYVIRSEAAPSINTMRYEDNSTIFGWIADGVTLELMQFTGLLDKNGKEIYESDRFLFGTIDGIVEYKNGCFVFQGKNCSMTMRDHESNEFEITGNIYQTPDLLK